MLEHDIRKKVKLGDSEYYFKEYFSNDFSNLKPASQVLAVVLNEKNEVLLVSEDEEWWTIPGGTVETNETYMQTLVREVYEESAVKIRVDKIEPFFYLKRFKIVGNRQIYQITQLRYIARVDSIDEFVKDPGGDHKFRKFIPIDELDSVLPWTGTGAFMKKFLKSYIDTGKLYT